MNPRPSLIVRWEELHVGAQVVVAFVVATLVLWAVHILLLNQPVGRGFVYGLFWAVPVTAIVVLATRTERARRIGADGERGE